MTDFYPHKIPKSQSNLHASFILFLVSCTYLPKIEKPFQSSHSIEGVYMRGTKTVMIAHPGCGFSNQAFKDFSYKIKDYFTKNAIFIAPISETHTKEDIIAVQNWNKESQFKHIVVLRTTKLHSLDLNSTPQFYFFRDGVLVKRIIGWPKDKSNLKNLEDAIETVY